MVMLKDDTTQTGYRNVGHITKSQFQGLMSEGIIFCLDSRPGNKDKDGNLYRYYELARPEKGA